jgi:hypothetical protein
MYLLSYLLFEAFRNYLKIRIFGRDQGEAEDQPGGILKYVEDLRQGLNADTGRKGFFELTSGLLDAGYLKRFKCFFIDPMTAKSQ